MEAEIECEFCGSKILVDIEDVEDGSQEVECDVCGALFEVGYTVSIDVDSVEIIEGPSVEVECPKCGWTIIIDVNDESGSEKIECEKCSKELEIHWSEWGQNICAEVLEEDEDDEDEDDEDEDDEDEDDEEW